MKRLAVFVLGLTLFAANVSKSLDDGKIPITTASEEARKEFLKGRELADNLQATLSIQHFDKAISLDPAFASAYLNRATASLTAKEFFANLKEAIAHKDAVSEAERLLIMANDAGANGNVLKQKECLEKLVALYPSDERARFNLGTYHFGQQEYQKAIAEFEKSIQLVDRFAPSYNILGYAYRQIEEYDKAEKIFRKYTELIPNDANPYDSYAELLLKVGRFDESITNYHKALAIDPNFMASHVGIATNLMYQGKVKEATEELDRTYAIARNDGERRQALFTQMVVYIDAGKFDPALRELDKQYEIAEKSKDVGGMSGDLGLRGNILLQMGKYELALNAFQASMEKIYSSDLSDEIKGNAMLFSHYNTALVAIASHDVKKAKAEAKEFQVGAELKKNANQIRLVHQLNGLIAMEEKSGDGGVSELLQSNLQDPYDLYRIGLAYSANGDKKHAKEYFTKSAEFNSLPFLNYAFVRAKAAKMAGEM